MNFLLVSIRSVAPWMLLVWLYSSATVQAQSSGCDIDLKFINSPTNDGFLIVNQPAQIILLARNVGRGNCPQLSLKLIRYKGRQGWVEGDPHGLEALRPGQSKRMSWSVNARQAGNFIYKPKFVGGFSDANSANHQPQKKYKVTFLDKG